MTKEEVLMQFEEDFLDPGSEKSGEYLYEHILKRAKRLIISDHLGVVEALRFWLSPRKIPHTVMAVRLVRDLSIKELKTDLEKLNDEIREGITFLPYVKNLVDEALKAIE